MTELSPLKQQLKTLCKLGSTAMERIDRLLRVNEANMQADLATMMSLAATSDLQRLVTALECNRVISGAYRRIDGRGCVANVLFGFESNDQLFSHKFPTEEDFCAVSRSIRNWDYARVQKSDVLKAALAELERRLPMRAVREQCRLEKDFDPAPAYSGNPV